jgi:hypothetical protein
MGSYETCISGIRILPGCWRPHYPFEQIAWISPPWPSQDYLWFDFPEAIFTNVGLLYLSHVNPAFPCLFPDLPHVPWKRLSDGIAFERRLPNGVRFGGRLVRQNDQAVGTELYIFNGSQNTLADIKLQTCVFLRAIKEFSDYTAENKFVHIPEMGWVPFPKACRMEREAGRYRLGWRGGRALADLPVIATVSRDGRRLVAMTWFEDTYSLVNNPDHPCMHADPFFPTMEPGMRARVRGELIFFEGNLDDFSERLEPRLSSSLR